jgi:hypothetical protein
LLGCWDKWLDPTTSFATAFDPVAQSRLSGFMRKKRGVRPGCPDNWVLHCGRLICVELKSPVGRCSRAQRVVRETILAARGSWWMCLSANSAMWALAESGVKFREIVHADGTTERWRRPKLEAWERPRRDPSERRPQHPEVAVERRDAARRRREHQRALKTAKSATEHGGGAQPAGWRNVACSPISVSDDCAATRAKALPRRKSRMNDVS